MKSQPVIKAVAVVLFFAVTFRPPRTFGQRAFTPKDDVELTLFEYAGIGTPAGAIKYSPNSNYFVVVTERGRLDVNAPEDTIWVFRTDEIQRFSQHPDRSNRPRPLPVAQTASDKDGPLIENVRWLPDSSGIAFTTVRKSFCCKFHQLFVADIKTRIVKTLAPEDQDVGEF